MDKQYDVIVIGAGNGGLMAAVKTAAAGYSTLVIEKNNVAGGCATSFRRGRFEFELALHELCNVGNEDCQGAIYKLFKEAGTKTQWIYENNLYRVICEGENGFDAIFKGGSKEEFCRSIEEAVPGSYESVKRLFEVSENCMAALDYMDRKNGKVNKLLFLAKFPDFIKASCHTVNEIMEELKVPKKAAAIIGAYWIYLGIPTDELSGMHFLNMINCYVRMGAAMIPDRSHGLSMSLEQAVRNLGGEFAFNTEVTEILYDASGAACGVTAGGHNIYAGKIIANISPHMAYALSKSEYVPKWERKLANARKLGLSFVTAYIGLNASAQELGIEDYSVIFLKDSDTRMQYENLDKGYAYFVNCLNITIPDCTPEGTSMLFITIPLQGDDVPETTDEFNYHKYKNDFVYSILRDYEKRMNLDIISHIEEIAIAAKPTFARFLGTPAGAVYGYAVSDWDAILQRNLSFDRDFSVKNLFYCGGHGVNGDGFSSAYSSGNSAGKKVINSLREDEEKKNGEGRISNS